MTAGQDSLISRSLTDPGAGQKGTSRLNRLTKSLTDPIGLLLTYRKQRNARTCCPEPFVAITKRREASVFYGSARYIFLTEITQKKLLKHDAISAILHVKTRVIFLRLTCLRDRHHMQVASKTISLSKRYFNFQPELQQKNQSMLRSFQRKIP